MSAAATRADSAAGHGTTPTAPDAGGPRLQVAVYSDKSPIRDRVRRAIGRRPAADVPLVELHEFATLPALLRAVDSHRFDVLVLDGEAAPAGGLGVCRQLHDEIYDCPPVLVLTGRPQDAWLAAWSKAEAAVPHPLDPRAVADAVASLARRRVSAPPA
jgi:DNA-binding response OmpR family regulator